MRRGLLLAAGALLCPGCFAGSYLGQAVRGEWEILEKARPIGEVVADPSQPDRTRRLLISVQAIKTYGEYRGLRPTGNFQSYADLERPAAAWVVQASAPLAFNVKAWVFPVVGTVPYLGFLSRRAARDYAASLAREEDLDVEVRLAGAFSTLGWFHDPVLSTMIPAGEEALGELADAVLHESVHATVHIPNQSPFNESLASFVAHRLAAAWLDEALGPDAPETRTWLSAQAGEEALVARLHQAYVELDALYNSSAADSAKRAEKARILGALREEVHASRPINNATLAGYKTYDTGVAAFGRLLAACMGDVRRLLEAIKGLTEADFARPQQQELEEVIDRLSRKGCPAAPRRGARAVAGSARPQ